MRWFPAAWLIVGGCGFSRADIDAILDANATIVADVEARTETIETLLPSDPAGHGRGDGEYAFDGVLDASAGGWESGEVTVSGTGSSASSGSILLYQLHLVYDRVLVDGTTYDGDVDADLSVLISNGDVTVVDAITGTVTCAGDVTGDADMDWRMEASSTTGGQPHYTGTISGRKVGE